MAQFVRGKQAGVSNDFSAGIAADIFTLDIVARYGINSQTSALAYDPVQSLLAVGTKESRFGSGQIYVFGQKRVAVIFTPPRKCSIEKLQFCADKLVSLDSRNDLTVWSLERKAPMGVFSPPGRATTIATDPAIDYAFVGLQNGSVVAFDMERGAAAPFKIQELWREFDPRARMIPVVSLALHPRDVGNLLIGYPEGAAVFSFKQNGPVQFYRYELPPGAPGGYGDPAGSQKPRYPKLVHALWHPTGTFILTAHEDETLVIWDPKTARVIQARTLQNANVNQRGAVSGSFGGNIAPKTPFFKIAWCGKQNPDDTGLLVAGGEPTDRPDRGLTFMELGPTPVYATSSWQVLSDHFARPKKTSLLPTPPDVDVVDFCLIPRNSPHFAGAQDPLAIIAVLSSGEMTTMSFPSGHPITPTNHLHPSMSFVHPFVGSIALSVVDRTRWLGMTEKRPSGPPLVHGGAEERRPMKRFENRNIIQTSHADGTIRIWDTGDADEIQNPDVIQVDVARALGRMEDIEILQMSMSGAAGELAAGMQSGEVAIFRWNKNSNYGREMPFTPQEELGMIPIDTNTDPGLKEGMLPLTMYPGSGIPCTALKMSDIGFCAAGFENDSISVIDLRGPAIIYEGGIADTAKMERRRSIRRSNSQAASGRPEWATTIEFGIMSLDEDAYSSILLFVGTSQGRVLTFKIVPGGNGAFSVQPAGSTNVEDGVVMLYPLNAQTGQAASASQNAYAGLRSGKPLDGVLVAVSKGGVRIFKPAASRGASKSWNDCICDAAAVAFVEDRQALLALFGDGTAKTFSIPGLKELSSIRLDGILDVSRFGDAVIAANADVIGWTGPSEVGIVNPWGAGMDSSYQNDELFNPELVIPPRPTISNVQWISGTQYVTPADMDELIGGADRPPSKRMVNQMRAEGPQRAGGAGASSSAAGSNQDEGYWAYMQRQMQERTERMNLTGDAMDRLQESSANWADDVSKYISQQKRKAAMGMVTSKFGF